MKKLVLLLTLLAGGSALAQPLVRSPWTTNQLPNNATAGAVTLGSLTVNGASSMSGSLALLGIPVDTGNDVLYASGTFPFLVGAVNNANPGGFFLKDNMTFSALSGSGAALTSLNANNITSGTVAPAQLGSGTANATTALFGDSTYKTITGPAAHTVRMLFVGTNQTCNVSNALTRVSMFGTNAGVGTLTLQPSDMNVGTTLHVTLSGPFAENGGDTLNFGLFLGGVMIATNTYAPGLIGNAFFLLEADITFRATGAGGQVNTDGYLWASQFNVAMGGITKLAQLTTIDTTAARTLDATVSWQTAVTSDQFVIDTAKVQYAP